MYSLRNYFIQICPATEIRVRTKPECQTTKKINEQRNRKHAADRWNKARDNDVQKIRQTETVDSAPDTRTKLICTIQMKTNYNLCDTFSHLISLLTRLT